MFASVAIVVAMEEQKQTPAAAVHAEQQKPVAPPVPPPAATRTVSNTGVSSSTSVTTVSTNATVEVWTDEKCIELLDKWCASMLTLKKSPPLSSVFLTVLQGVSERFTDDQEAMVRRLMPLVANKFYSRDRKMFATAIQLGRAMPHVGSGESASEVVALVSIVVQLLGAEKTTKSRDKEFVVRDIVQVVLSLLTLTQPEIILINTAVTVAIQTFVCAKAMYRVGLLQKLFRFCCCSGGGRQPIVPESAPASPLAVAPAQPPVAEA